jgi:non-specific serine/threonine protein kinase/serine/threonine-protein kinase
MGTVFEAEQQQPRRRVALKVLRGSGHTDDLHVRLFRREVDTLARLRHPI